MDGGSTPDSTDKAMWLGHLDAFTKDVERMNKGVMASALGVLGLQQTASSNQNNSSMSTMMLAGFSAAISAATSK